MTVQIDELNMAVQNILMGKLPVAILKPNVLHNILRNISLIMPQNYELAAGIKIENIHAYYELIKTSIVGNAHGLHLILEVPLKTANQIFNLYRIVTLPTKAFNDTFARYELDFDYFGLTYNQRDYVRMTETDTQKCSTGSITVSPANNAILDVQTLTCESELYFQKTTKDRTYERKLMIHYKTPTLVQHGSTWIYHFPTPSKLTIRCTHGNTWKVETRTLSGAGLIENATASEITTSEFRTIPELHGATHVNMETPLVYAPKDIPILNSHELPDVKVALSSGINELERIRDHFQTSQKILDVDTLLHVKNTVQPQTTASHWPVIAAATLGTLMTVLILYLFNKENAGTFYHTRFSEATRAARFNPITKNRR
jgi:hypothetical protein